MPLPVKAFTFTVSYLPAPLKSHQDSLQILNRFTGHKKQLMFHFFK
jgi:hypothetical protein